MAADSDVIIALREPQSAGEIHVVWQTGAPAVSVRAIGGDVGYTVRTGRVQVENRRPALRYEIILPPTIPGVTRGPHEHEDQADLFCFIGPSNFKLRLWDNRADSETFNNVLTLVAGEENPKSVLIPAGVVHAYQNVGLISGIVFNCPNRLYMGVGKKEKIDEIRHEDDPNTIYRIED